MPFIRLSDTYIDHPKFLALSASAFRLWHEGMAFCRKHQTDGLIPMGTLQGFRYYKAVRADELARPYRAGAHPLWETVPDFGYQVHNYLFWNLSKEEEQTDRDAATARMRRLRKERRDAPCSPEQPPEQPPERSPQCSPFVPDRIGSDRERKPERGTGGKPPVTARSKRPIFTGQSFAVFEWMLDDFMRMLGKHTDAFGLDEWLDKLDQHTVAQGMIVPKDSVWAWLQQEFMAEVRLRGLPVAEIGPKRLTESAASMDAAVLELVQKTRHD